MRWSSVLSTAPRADDALDELVARSTAALPAPDLALVFVHPRHAGAFGRIGPALAARIGARALVGASALGVIGGGREVEGETAMALVTASLPEVEVRAFHLRPGEVPRAAPDWEARTGVPAGAGAAFVVLPDPFSADVDATLGALDRAFPGAVTVGGLASGGRAAGQNVLYVDGVAHAGGTVGVALWGDVEVLPVVAQGARGIGEAMRVTRVSGTRLLELDGVPALRRLDAMYQALPAADQALFRRAPMLGVAPAELPGVPRHGDWLIRNVLGVDRATEAVGVGWRLDPGARVRFHLRDPAAAAADLDELLGRVPSHPAVAGALLFSCLGRGAGFFGVPDHDSEALQRRLGPVPVGGFFASGEIGPVHARTWQHGYTSSFALFRPRVWD